MSTIEQVKSNEVIEWKNGDECQHKSGIRYTFIGQCDNPKAFDCFLMDSSGNAVLSFINELRKPETESERKDRERLENGRALWLAHNNSMADVKILPSKPNKAWDSGMVSDIEKEAWCISAETIGYRKSTN